MSLTLVTTLRGHKGAVWGLSFSAAGLLASCGVDRTVRVWSRGADGSTWTCVAVASDTFRRTVRSLAWGSDGRSLAAACFDGITTVLELTGGAEPKLEPAVSLAGHENEVKGVAFSGSGGLLATCSRDRSVWIWEVGLDYDYECIAVLNGHAADVKAVVWHPKCEILVSCGYDNVCKVWVEDEDDWFCAETLAAHSSTVWAAAFSPGGERLATCSADQSVVFWKREGTHASVIGAQPTFKVAGRCADVHDGPVYSCAFSADGARVASAGGDDSIAILMKVEKEMGREGKCNGKEDPDGTAGTDENDANEEGSTSKHVKREVSGEASQDEEWQIAARAVRAHSGDVNNVLWLPGSNDIVASCGDDGLVRIWKFSERAE